MYSKLHTCILQGLIGTAVDVEGHLSNGLPQFSIVGLPDTSIKESKERVRSAIINSGFRFPVARITINLSPAGVRKEGSQLDLSIALAILAAEGTITDEVDPHCAFLGELNLNGDLVGVPGLLPMAISLAEEGFNRVVVPKANISECEGLSNIELIPANSLSEVVAYLNKELEIHPMPIAPFVVRQENAYDVDFSEIHGQKNLKRAMEVAAAGHHNLLIIGPPGSGKTMAAKRMPTILPDLTFDESIESTKIYSVSNLLKQEGLLHTRPFRAPHHTASAASLIGGGTTPKPGEVSLAHNGVLFLDEFPEFPKHVIEALRQPLEDGIVTISRANAQITYPSDFILLASMNPCPCGYYGDEKHECKCSLREIQRYIGKISHPILDRIDLHVEVKAVPFDDLQKPTEEETSEEIRARVEAAHRIQHERYEGENVRYNSGLGNRLIKKYIVLGDGEKDLLKKAYDTYHFSARSMNKILKIARTIADLAGKEQIERMHLLEAIRFRSLDDKYWNI